MFLEHPVCSFNVRDVLIRNTKIDPDVSFLLNFIFKNSTKLIVCMDCFDVDTGKVVVIQDSFESFVQLFCRVV